MAAKTPSTVKRYSSGDLTKIRADFTDLDDGDTWTSGLPNIINYWIQRTDDPTTQTSAGIVVSGVSSTGVFTFYPAEDNSTASLFVEFAG